MKKSLLLSGIALIAVCSVMQATKVDFQSIRHWAGSGEKKAALIIQFNDGKDEVGYVWGYRWNGTASGEDMVRAVARASRTLTALVQYTGSMGSTLDGVGLSQDRVHLSHLEYDFQSAAVEGQVSFGYFEPNTMMGQTTAPGNSTPQLIQNAIEASRTTGIIEHPLNARRYGYPAYDYDFWKLSQDYREDPELHWQAGWYDGYWSYWLCDTDTDLSDASYSGLGMSSAQLADGSVNLWNYNPDMSQYGSAPDPCENLDYEMAAFDESMSEPTPDTYAVDFDKIKCWYGSGEKYAALVIKFNDGKNPDNLVMGYRWSGGWDDSLSTMLHNVFNANKTFHVTWDNNTITSIGFDSDGNGTVDGHEHNEATGTWHVYADYANESETYEVPMGSFVNPRAVMILTRTPENATPDFTADDPVYLNEHGLSDNITSVVNLTTSVPSVVVSADGHVILSNCAGYDFSIMDISGKTISCFSCDSDFMTFNPSAGRGLYVIHGTSGNNTITTKYLVK